MSTLEIAGLTGKRHDHVLRDADKMLAELGSNAPKFGGVYLDAKGEQRRCINLPKRECLILVSGRVMAGFCGIEARPFDQGKGGHFN